MLVLEVLACLHRTITLQLFKVKVKSLSRVRLFATPWIVAHGIFQARVLEWV